MNFFYLILDYISRNKKSLELFLIVWKIEKFSSSAMAPYAIKDYFIDRQINNFILLSFYLEKVIGIRLCIQYQCTYTSIHFNGNYNT